MNRLAIGPIALLTVAVSAMAAMAAGVTGSVGVDGTVANRCVFTSTNVVLNIGEMINTSGPSGSIGLLDPSKVNSQTAVLSGLCNGTSATMSVRAFPMLNTSFASAAPSGFSKRVDFTATAQVLTGSGIVSVSNDTVSPAASLPQSLGVFANDINVSFSNVAAVNNALLIAGSYEGSVVVTLSPST